MTSTSVYVRSNSQQLRFKIELVLPELAVTARRFWLHPRLADLYPAFLVAMHGLVRASVPLMQAAHDRALPMVDSDPVAAELVKYCAHHIPEERGHDDWILGDLEVIGKNRADVLRQPPSATIAELVGSQYYWINHFHPVALLGYIAVVEGYPPSLEGVAEAGRMTGYPASAFRTLAKHAQLDIRHRDDLNRFLDTLPLTQELTTVLGVSALRTVALTCQMLDDIMVA